MEWWNGDFDKDLYCCLTVEKTTSDMRSNHIVSFAGFLINLNTTEKYWMNIQK